MYTVELYARVRRAVLFERIDLLATADVVDHQERGTLADLSIPIAARPLHLYAKVLQGNPTLIAVEGAEMAQRQSPNDSRQTVSKWLSNSPPRSVKPAARPRLEIPPPPHPESTVLVRRAGSVLENAAVSRIFQPLARSEIAGCWPTFQY